MPIVIEILILRIGFIYAYSPLQSFTTKQTMIGSLIHTLNEKYRKKRKQNYSMTLFVTNKKYRLISI